MWSIVKQSGDPAIVRPAADAARRSLSVLPSMNHALLSSAMRPQRQYISHLVDSNRRMSSLAASNSTTTRLPSISHNLPTSCLLPSTGNSSMQYRHQSSQPPGGGGPGGSLGNIFNQQNQKKKPGETLEEYGVDLTKMAKDGKLDPVIGRHEEIRRTLQILGKCTI